MTDRIHDCEFDVSSISWGSYSLQFAWDNETWAFGWNDLFAFLGIGALIVGPLHIQVTWPVALGA